MNNAFWLPQTGVADEARVQYEQTLHALDEFIRKCFNEWTFSLENVSDRSGRTLNKINKLNKLFKKGTD